MSEVMNVGVMNVGQSCTIWPLLIKKWSFARFEVGENTFLKMGQYL